MDSLDPFIRRQKKPQDLEKLSRYTIENDRWDRRDFDRMLKQVPELSVARKQLADNIAGDLGYDEGADALWMLHKIAPTLLPDHEIRPSRLINARVNGELEQLPEYDNVRRWTAGEMVAASHAFVKMEPDIEILYDRLEKEMEKQKEYEQKLKEALEAQQEERSVDEMIAEWQEENEPPPEEGEGEGDGEGEEEGDGEGQPGGQGQGIPQGLADQKAQAHANSQAAQAAAQQALEQLQQALDAAAPEIRQSLKEAAEKANDYLDSMNSMSQSWGQELKDLMRLPAEKRLELARRLDTPKFKQMAKLIGPAIREAFASQKRKIIQVPEEIVDLTLGDDLPRVIPPAWAQFDQEETEILFLKDLVEHNLPQYEMKGTEKLARGGIIYIHDGSGSMGGDREIWAKAIGLALLLVARKQKRSFYGIQFGSPGQIRVDDFRDTRNITPEAVIDFAEFFFGGGTDFQTPLKHAQEILLREHQEFGAVQADIVFATDGCAGVTDEFMKNFKLMQKKLDFTVWGIAIQAGPNAAPYEAGLQSEPLNTICDGKVATVSSILNAKDIGSVFKGL